MYFLVFSADLDNNVFKLVIFKKKMNVLILFNMIIFNTDNYRLIKHLNI